MNDEKSLSDEATFAGAAQRRPAAEVSIGDERTLGDNRSGQDTVIDDIEVVDLEARYKVEGTLGQGGMGAVLLATDTRLDRKVAIKRILGEAAGNRMAVQRFLTEAKAIAALNHPNIVQIYDYGRAKDGPFLIMEYVDGGSLLDRCRESALPLDEAIDLACQLCDGLAKAHDLGIIHRDIKPANVLLTKDGIPKLTDFGLAKAQASDHGQTMTGAVLGTPDFMPPEQRRDASLVDHRSDLWSLAATVYQMVTGRSPKIIRFDLLPVALTKVLGKALEDAKDSRYQTARELRDALKVSLRSTASATIAAVGEGQCPACGVQNDSKRKFCRGCGASLESPCLKCSEPMPVWEEICGSCGAKQAQLVEAKRSEMSALQAKAEGLLGDFEFARATEIAQQLRDEPCSWAGDVKQWAVAFLEQITKSRNDQVGRATAAINDALRHEASYDYATGVRVLGAVPQAVRKQVNVSAGQSGEDVLMRLEGRLQESRDLEAAVRAAVTKKALAGLHAKAMRLAELRPDRADYAKLCRQLEERSLRLTQQRDGLLQQARQSFGKKDYVAAIRLLEQISPEVATAEVNELGARCEASQKRSLILKDTISAAIAEKRYDGLLAAIDEFTTLKPTTPDLEKIREQLVEQEVRRAADQAAQRRRVMRRRLATASFVLLVAGAAIGGGLWYRSELQRKEALKTALANALDARRWDEALSYDPANSAALIGRARAKLSEPRPDFDAVFDALSAAERSDAGPETLRDVRGAALLARARARLAEKPADFAGALADLESRESIIPGSPQATETKAAAFAQRAAVLAADGKIADAEKDLTEAERLGVAAWLVQPAKKVIGASYASRVEQLAETEEDFDAIAAACDSAIDAGAPKQAIAKVWGRFVDAAVRKGNVETVRLALQKGLQSGMPVQQAAGAWRNLAESALDRGDTAGLEAACTANEDFRLPPAQQAALWKRVAEMAIEKKDGPAVVAACDRAIAAGGSKSELAAFRNRGMFLQARASLDRGAPADALQVVTSAIEDNEAAALAELRQPESQPLKEALLRDCRMRFNSKVEADGFVEAATIYALATKIDPMTRSWYEGLLPPERVGKLSGESLSALPAEVILAMPPIENTVGMKFKLIPSGTFTTVRWGFHERPQVTIVKPFFIGIHEVTRSQSQAAMPKRLDKSWKGDDRPVTGVNWHESMEFCRLLSELPQEKELGRAYRLPTTTEWEYACRAGTKTNYSFGNDAQRLGDYAWYLGNAAEQLQPVGRKKPNGWGLYDMHGNVWEWCDNNSDDTNEQFAGGGSWKAMHWACTSSDYIGRSPDFRHDDLGLRLAFSPPVVTLPGPQESIAGDATAGAAHVPPASGNLADVATAPIKQPSQSAKIDPIVCPKLGHACIFCDGDWNGKWSRRGDTNVFDCEMLHAQARETVNYVATIEMREGKVHIRRDHYRSTRTGENPPEGTSEWTGSLSDDGKEIRWGAESYLRSAK